MPLRKHRSGDRATGARHPRPRRLWLYGAHPVIAALTNPARRCHRLLATATALAEMRRRLGGDLGRAHLHVDAATTDDLARVLSPDARHQGLALEVEPLPAQPLETACAPNLDAAQAPRVVVLDRVTDPQNVGAVLRAAAAFGGLAVIVPERHAPGESGVLAKAASGALEVAPVVRVPNLARALGQLKQLGYWCLGLDPAARDTLAAADPRGAVALVLGAEGAGLRRLTRERCDALVRVPISDAVDSLNVASAAAVALYALARHD